ncbi:phosphoketolase [Armillaria mellea]|nr:phosphoketolase [Armillaria mellea]
MPGQVLFQPNPLPDPSQLSDAFLDFSVKLDTHNYLPADELKAVQKFRRAADYIAAAMIFLKDNVLCEKALTYENIKPRLLGHWGTCPGLMMVYAHLNRIIRKTGLEALYVVGPGHGAPAILSCLWLEDSMSVLLPEYTRDYKGLRGLISKFSAPGGFPSHINAETPGAIHEGGELGYALSPDLVVACVVGDGEAETGPTAAAWHGFKYIDPAESGAVLPIVHVNGFKISERTIYGTMDDKEMTALFTGYGYQVRIVSDIDNIDNDLAASMEWALAEIRNIQTAARTGNPIVKPRWPVIILRTPKGLAGPKSFHGELIEGSFHSHQIPLPNAKTSSEELAELQRWLKSYRPEELFTTEGSPVDEILSLEESEKKLGQKKESYKAYVPLDLPEWSGLAVEKGSQESCMRAIGRFLKEVVNQNPSTFRIFSPDELVSNKLDAVLESSGRNFQWDIASRASGVVEILSEHTCQGMLQGYTLTGRTGLFPSYEAFLGIVHTMMVQYAKFAKMNPSFIGAVLNLKSISARVYLPPDANCFLSTVSHCLRAKNYVNLMVGSKQPTPVWLSAEEADRHCVAGASVWKFASVDDGVDPDVVLVGIGVEVTFEVIAAASLLRKYAPDLRVRVVNVTDLMILAATGLHPHALSKDAFNNLFTEDKPIHFNYHGYPIELKGLLFSRSKLDRVSIEGYNEEGTTTSPFDMMLANRTSRYHIAQAAVRGGALTNPKVAVSAHETESYFKHLAQKEKDYIYANGQDRPDIFEVPTFN